MSETSPELFNGFSAENIERIYHGEPALVGNDVPANLLGERELAAITCIADGLTQKETLGVLGKTNPDVVRRDIRMARTRLGVMDTLQLAGYFPMDETYDAVGDKKLADLEKIPHGLDILEAISKGKRQKQIRGGDIKRRTIETSLNDIEQVWEDIEGGLIATRVANAIRARYVRTLEAMPGTLREGQLSKLTLPVLAKLEPRIEKEFSVRN